MKVHIVYYPSHMAYLEETNPYSQKVDWWFPGKGKNGE
jgi:hypothetical protein